MPPKSIFKSIAKKNVQLTFQANYHYKYIIMFWSKSVL